MRYVPNINRYNINYFIKYILVNRPSYYYIKILKNREAKLFCELYRYNTNFYIYIDKGDNYFIINNKLYF